MSKGNLTAKEVVFTNQQLWTISKCMLVTHTIRLKVEMGNYRPMSQQPIILFLSKPLNKAHTFIIIITDWNICRRNSNHLDTSFGTVTLWY